MGAVVHFPRPAPRRDSRAVRLAEGKALLEAHDYCWRAERAIRAAVEQGDLQRAAARLERLVSFEPDCAMPDPRLYQARRAARLFDLVLAAHARQKAKGICA